MSEIIVDPSLDLAGINKLIAQQEDFLKGPLTKIGVSNGKTTFHISDLDGKPKKNAELTTGNPPIGATIIGAAKIFVTGGQVDVIAYRPA